MVPDTRVVSFHTCGGKSGLLAAFSILYAAPVLALYLLVQRLSGGSFAMAGAVKG